MKRGTQISGGAILALLVLCALLVWWQTSRAPRLSELSAAGLVQQVRQSEQWVHEIDGIRMRFEGKWTRSPEAIAASKKELRASLPAAELTPQRFEELRPEQTETLEIVFDRHRFKLVDRREGGWAREAAWDGYRAVEHLGSPDRNTYSIEPRPYRLGRLLFMGLSWLRTQPQAFTWISTEFEDVPDTERAARKAADQQWWKAEYELVGREKYRGINCWRLSRKGPDFECWLIGIKTGRLHGILTAELPDPDADLRTATAVLAKWGQSVKSQAEVEAWVTRQDAVTQQQVTEQFDRLRRTTIHPAFEHWLLDYKELAPDRWFPMTQGYRIWRGNATNAYLEVQREFKAVDVRLDPHLSPETFQIDIPEGALVFDHIHDPWLSYKENKGRTPEEWQAIIEAAREREADKAGRESALDTLVGKPAPPFPTDARWLNTEPLTWRELKGQVVVLDFFAEWCAPCRKDLPMLSKAHRKREQTGVAIVGILVPGTKPEAIKKMLDEYELDYPICVDVPPTQATESWGIFFEHYHVQRIPQAFVVDADGVVAGHGDVPEAMRTALELAAGTRSN